MPSQKQLEANRRNAQKSTGPTSSAGKAGLFHERRQNRTLCQVPRHPRRKSRRPPATHRRVLLPAPSHSPEQRGVLDDLIACEWELRRLFASLAQLWRFNLDGIWDKDSQKHPNGKVANNSYKPQLALQRRLDSTRRARDRAVKLLRDLANRPIAAPEPLPEPAPEPVTPTPPSTSPQNGFVPSNPAAAPSPAPFPAPETPKTPPLIS